MSKANAGKETVRRTDVRSGGDVSQFFSEMPSKKQELGFKMEMKIGSSFTKSPAQESTE